jgi:hypothetical protein
LLTGLSAQTTTRAADVVIRRPEGRDGIGDTVLGSDIAGFNSAGKVFIFNGSLLDTPRVAMALIRKSPAVTNLTHS